MRTREEFHRSGPGRQVSQNRATTRVLYARSCRMESKHLSLLMRGEMLYEHVELGLAQRSTPTEIYKQQLLRRNQSNSSEHLSRIMPSAINGPWNTCAEELRDTCTLQKMNSVQRIPRNYVTARRPGQWIPKLAKTSVTMCMQRLVNVDHHRTVCLT